MVTAWTGDSTVAGLVCRGVDAEPSSLEDRTMGGVLLAVIGAGGVTEDVVTEGAEAPPTGLVAGGLVATEGAATAGHRCP